MDQQKKSKIYNFSDEEFKQIILTSNSLSDCCKKIGLSTSGQNGRYQIKKRCDELNIPLDFESQKSYHSHPKYTLDEVLVENSKYLNYTCLKNRLINEGYLEYKCQICGNTGVWNNQKLTLQLDHINGIKTDNRITNLRLLCPNCHSQTDTYSGKNK